MHRIRVQNLGMIGEYFDVPNGAFPVPWGGSDCQDPDGCGESSLGQAAGVTCEDTPEGGKRCSDGTYHPPGCPSMPGAQGSVQGTPSGQGGFPVVPVAIAAAGVIAAGAFLLGRGGRRQIGEEAPTEIPNDTVAKLTSLSHEILRARGDDAYYFKKQIAATNRRQDLVFKIATAEKAMAEQERLWEATHRNMDQLQAAQAAVDSLRAEKETAAADQVEATQQVQLAAQTVLAYRQNAEAIISYLPAELQDEAWQYIDPCRPKSKSMKGIQARPLMGQYSWNRAVQAPSSQYSWNTAVQVQPPSGMEAPAMAPAGGELYCYHCSNPELYDTLSEAQAKQWNERYNRQCIKVPEKNCKPGAAPTGARSGWGGGYGGLVDLFGATQGLRSAPLQTYALGNIPSRFEGVPAEEYNDSVRIMTRELGRPIPVRPIGFFS